METEIKRNFKFDNIKFFLIVTVVMIHTMEYFLPYHIIPKYIYIYVQALLGPSFLFVSGVFSKKLVERKNYSAISKYVVYYLIMKLLITLTRFICTGKMKFSLLYEEGIPWYMLSLFTILIITICLKDANKKYVLIFTVILACFCGYDSEINGWLSLSRTIVFFPFFWAGWSCSIQKIMKFAEGKIVKILAVGIHLTWCFIIIWQLEFMWKISPLFTGRYPFELLGQYAPYGGILRLLYYPIMFAVVISVVVLMPDIYCKISRFGRTTLQVYMFHDVILIILFEGFGMVNLFGELTNGRGYVLGVICSLIITLLLSAIGLKSIHIKQKIEVWKG